MHNKVYEDSLNGLPPMEQTNSFQHQQYSSYVLQPQNSYINQTANACDIYNKNQYHQNFYDVDNWLPENRFINENEAIMRIPDKIDNIEITSKDLSPASCCSNVDLFLPDIYKNLRDNNSYYYNSCSYSKNYMDYPSCSQVNFDQECNEKCSLPKSSGLPYDFSFYNQQNYERNDPFSHINLNEVFPTPEILNFDVSSIDQHTDASNDESDIIVEESEDEATDGSEATVKKFHCVVCNVGFSPVGNQFYFLTDKTPVTSTSQKPIAEKIKEVVGNFSKNDSYLCTHCLGLINSIDHLEETLQENKVQFLKRFQKTQNVQETSCKSNKIINKCIHKFKCRLCRKIFSLNTFYKKHLRFHKFHKRFLCEICGLRFTKLKQFRFHLGRHRVGKITQLGKIAQNIKLEPFFCKFCKKPFRTNSNLKEHTNYCLGKLPFKCRTCNKKFPTTTKLKNHIRLKHDKKFTSICSICNIGFIKVSDHKAHMITHSADKKFSCTKCDKSYKTIGNLNFHMKFHLEKLPFICSICSKGFMRKEYLDSHTSSHSGEKKYGCPICTKKFASQKNLEAHMKYHDGNVAKKPCNICGKLLSKGLEDHIRTHTNLKEFECDLCEMQFNTRNALLKHKKKKHISVNT